MSIYTVELPPKFSNNYEKDSFFGPIFRALDGEFPEDEVQKQRIERIVHLFQKNKGYYIMRIRFVYLEIMYATSYTWHTTVRFLVIFHLRRPCHDYQSITGRIRQDIQKLTVKDAYSVNSIKILDRSLWVTPNHWNFLNEDGAQWPQTLSPTFHLRNLFLTLLVPL